MTVLLSWFLYCVYHMLVKDASFSPLHAHRGTTRGHTLCWGCVNSQSETLNMGEKQAAAPVTWRCH